VQHSFDFGDFTDATNLTMGDPYVKLMSTTNITAASLEFNKVRGGNTTLTINGSGDAFGSTTVASGSAGQSTGPASSLTLQQVNDKVSKLQSYTPALIGVLAANALIMLVLIGVGIMLLIRKMKDGRGGRGSGRRRGPGNTISTMELAPTTSGGSDGGAGAKYAPVSLQNPDAEAAGIGAEGTADVTAAYETPAYRQSTAVSFRMNEPYRESQVL